jgi:hypothetical protein
MKDEMASIDEECKTAEDKVVKMVEQRDRGLQACNKTQNQIKVKREAYMKSF